MFKKNFNKKLFYILAIIIFINILITLIPNLGEDEAFTISLIKHNFFNIINIDKLDVHPPLYYLCLKLFIQLTTFWTNSIIIKVIFSRIFSLITFSILFYLLIKILSILKIHINEFHLLIFYLIFPSISYFLTYIRMYQFSAMLMAIEVYGLILYKIKNDNKGLYLASLSIILNMYTNYFASMFAGIYLIIDAFYYLIKHDKRAHNIIESGLIDIILFIPCIKFCLYQIRYVSSNTYSNQLGASRFTIWYQAFYILVGHTGSGKISFIFDIMLFIIELSIMVDIYKNSSSNDFKVLIGKLYLSFTLGIIVMVTYFLSKGKSLTQVRYGFPIFSIIYFFLIIYVLKKFQLNTKFKYFLTLILIIILLIINIKNTSLNSIKAFSTTDMPIISRIIKHNRATSNYLFFKNSNNSGGTINATLYSTYSSNNPKRHIIVNHLSSRYTLGSNNNKLMHEVYNNIIIK